MKTTVQLLAQLIQVPGSTATLKRGSEHCVVAQHKPNYDAYLKPNLSAYPLMPFLYKTGLLVCNRDLRTYKLKSNIVMTKVGKLIVLCQEKFDLLV